jgi:rhodanese-related sulfurtransferase
MNRRSQVLSRGILAGAFLLAFSFASLASDVSRITKEELKGLLGKENVLIIDVRSDIDLEKSNQKIQGAVIEDLGKVETWMAKYPKDKTLIFYCS